MSHTMTTAEREDYLAGLHVGIIGVNVGDRPLVVPIWYDYEPGGDVWVITEPDGVKGRALEETRWYSMCAQTEDLPYSYVTVEGPITAIEDCSAQVRLAMAERYLGAEMAQGYIAETEAEAGSSAVYRMTPERWYTVDYSKDFQD